MPVKKKQTLVLKFPRWTKFNNSTLLLIGTGVTQNLFLMLFFLEIFFGKAFKSLTQTSEINTQNLHDIMN